MVHDQNEYECVDQTRPTSRSTHREDIAAATALQGFERATFHTCRPCHKVIGHSHVFPPSGVNGRVRRTSKNMNMPHTTVAAIGVFGLPHRPSKGNNAAHYSCRGGRRRRPDPPGLPLRGREKGAKTRSNACDGSRGGGDGSGSSSLRVVFEPSLEVKENQVPDIQNQIHAYATLLYHGHLHAGARPVFWSLDPFGLNMLFSVESTVSQ